MANINDTKTRAPRSLAGVAPLALSVETVVSVGSRLLVPLLLAEAAVFADFAVSGKIPASLITALRALLTL